MREARGAILEITRPCFLICRCQKTMTKGRVRRRNEKPLGQVIEWTLPVIKRDRSWVILCSCHCFSFLSKTFKSASPPVPQQCGCYQHALRLYNTIRRSRETLQKNSYRQIREMLVTVWTVRTNTTAFGVGRSVFWQRDAKGLKETRLLPGTEHREWTFVVVVRQPLLN